jgi:hypothetical protein
LDYFSAVQAVKLLISKNPLCQVSFLFIPSKRCAGVAPSISGDRGKKIALRNHLLHKALRVEDNGLEPMTFWLPE